MTMIKVHELPVIGACPVCGTRHKPYIKKCSEMFGGKFFEKGITESSCYIRIKCRDCGHEVNTPIERHLHGLEQIKRTEKEARILGIMRWNEKSYIQNVMGRKKRQILAEKTPQNVSTTQHRGNIKVTQVINPPAEIRYTVDNKTGQIGFLFV